MIEYKKKYFSCTRCAGGCGFKGLVAHRCSKSRQGRTFEIYAYWLCNVCGSINEEPVDL